MSIGAYDQVGLDILGSRLTGVLNRGFHREVSAGVVGRTIRRGSDHSHKVSLQHLVDGDAILIGVVLDDLLTGVGIDTGGVNGDDAITGTIAVQSPGGGSRPATNDIAQRLRVSA